MLWPNISTSRNLCVLNRLKYVHKRIFVVALFIKQKIRERKKSQNSSLDQIWQRGTPKRSSSVPQNPKELENSKDMKGERGAVVYRKQKDGYRKKRQDQDRDTEERTGEDTWGWPPPGPGEGPQDISAVHSSISHFQPPGLRGNTFLSFKKPGCDISL